MGSPSEIRNPQSAIRNSSSSFRIQVAFLLALLFHVSLFVWFQLIYLPNQALPSQEKLILRKFKLERVEIPSTWLDQKIPTPKNVAINSPQEPSSLQPAPEKRTFAQILSQTPSSPTLPPGKPAVPHDKPIPSIGSEDLSAPDTRALLEKELNATREQQLTKSTKASSKGRPILETPGAAVVPKPGSTEVGLPHTAKTGPAKGPHLGNDTPTFKGSNRMEDFFGIGGGLPPPAPVEKPVIKETASIVPQSLNDKPKTTQKFDSLNSFLNVELFTYEKDSQVGSREGYFLIRITAKPNKQLQIIPKDVYFVLDVSSSIGPARLNEFRETILSAVSQLNASDRFQVFAFRGGLIPFNNDWLTAKNPRLDDLEGWLTKLDSGGVTDLFEGLQPLTRHKREGGRMSMAFVMSDGMPTKGVLDSTQIISELTQENENATSIFTLSNGVQVNNFLLDFLSYSNQGWLRYSEDTSQSQSKFRGLVKQVKNPLFLDLRFRFAGVEGDQAYPQNLPNLYQDSPLLLFGRYTPGETSSISLQILGESFNKTKELLVQLPIPKTPNGPETLPETWARQRIYDLLGRMTRSRGPSPTILAEVEKLSEDYNVEVPYLK
jgi:hypothetical protein